MCGPSGDGGAAAREARIRESHRRQQVERATSAIDKAFEGRGGQLDEFAEALRANFLTSATRQKSDVDRKLKFGLARGGLTGGSVAADTGKELGREFQEGLLKGEQQVQGSLADLSGADAASRRQLIALAQSGGGLSSAASQAASAMQSNIQGARASGLASDIGDVFTNTRGLFVKQEEAAARRRGLAESEVYAEPFGNT